MRKQHRDVELIRVFAPDDAAVWSDTLPADWASTTPRKVRRKPRRRIVSAALVAVVAAIAYAAVFIDDDPSDSATTTSSTPRTVRSLLDPTSVTHFLLNDPSLTAYSADIVTPPTVGQQVHIWTGNSSGPIVSVDLHPHSGERYGIVGATREVVDGYEFVRLKTHCRSATDPSEKQCEVLISEVVIDDQWSVTVRATLLSGAEVARLASSVQVIDGVLVENSSLMETLGLGLTFEDESLDDLIFGRVEESVRYLTVEGEIATLRSAVGVSDNRLASIRYLATDAQRFFQGRTYGHLLATGEAFVAWEEQGRLLSLVGPGDASELATISLQVRPATDDEWSAMVYGLRPDFRVGDFATLGTDHASNAELWRAGLQLAERDGRTEFLWWWTVPGRDDYADSTPASSAVGTRPHAETVVVPGATFVFVSQPGKGGTVTVRTAAGTEYTAELTRPFPTQSLMYMTVIRVEEPGPVTVDIDGVAVTE